MPHKKVLYCTPLQEERNHERTRRQRPWDKQVKETKRRVLHTTILHKRNVNVIRNLKNQMEEMKSTLGYEFAKTMTDIEKNSSTLNISNIQENRTIFSSKSRCDDYNPHHFCIWMMNIFMHYHLTLGVYQKKCSVQWVHYPALMNWMPKLICILVIILYRHATYYSNKKEWFTWCQISQHEYELKTDKCFPISRRRRGCKCSRKNKWKKQINKQRKWKWERNATCYRQKQHNYSKPTCMKLTEIESQHVRLTQYDKTPE